MKPFNCWKKLNEELICRLALLDIVIPDNLFIKHSHNNLSPSNGGKSKSSLSSREEGHSLKDDLNIGRWMEIIQSIKCISITVCKKSM